MRWMRLTAGEAKMQLKYGFYFLYTVFTVLYIALLSALPPAWRPAAALLMIYSDPAAMGLFFMGAIVLFEKSERVTNSLAVSPVRPVEYTAAKLLSISLISLAVGLALALFGGVPVRAYLIAGIFLCSCLFSSIGLVIASGIDSLNGFILAAVPAEILTMVPAAAYIFGWDRPYMIAHPGVCMLKLCQNTPDAPAALLILLAWTAAFAAAAVRAAEKMRTRAGGAKL